MKHHNWIPACGGTEQPFRTRTGRTLQYLWCPATGEHAYYDVGNDVFLTNEEADEAIWGDKKTSIPEWRTQRGIL